MSSDLYLKINFIYLHNYTNFKAFVSKKIRFVIHIILGEKQEQWHASLPTIYIYIYILRRRYSFAIPAPSIG
jgi:hypothetical protein